MTSLLHGLLIAMVVAVVFVNGWTDAPNAIACCVSTGALPYKQAVKLAAICNLAGIVVMSFINSSVADTITGIIQLDLARPLHSVAALCAAMASIVLFAVAAWYFGIPTSESHALIAGLTGSAIALGTANAVNMAAWLKVLAGLVISLVLGFGSGYVVSKLLAPGLARTHGKTADWVQILSASGMAFMHGAQDGQKFLAVFLMAQAVAVGQSVSSGKASLLAMICVASVMALGTLTGGKRIISHIGGKMVALEKAQGACADIGGAICLLAASLTGIPMSTTHTKTTAIMGAGAATGEGKVHWSTVRGMILAWMITFPVCGMLGYLLTSLLIRFI